MCVACLHIDGVPFPGPYVFVCVYPISSLMVYFVLVVTSLKCLYVLPCPHPHSLKVVYLCVSVAC